MILLYHACVGPEANPACGAAKSHWTGKVTLANRNPDVYESGLESARY